MNIINFIITQISLLGSGRGIVRERSDDEDCSVLIVGFYNAYWGLRGYNPLTNPPVILKSQNDVLRPLIYKKHGAFYVE
jgi:hypothetical protein